MELKYKVWDKEQKKFLRIDDEDEECAKPNYYQDLYFTLNGKEDEDGYPYQIDADILPSTGVKDINKKEIYKGYILRNRISGRLWIVGYKDAAFILSYENRNIELLYDYVRNGILNDFEIVGNIYQNEELIKKENKTK